jgi:nucleoside 2-deoxyribosyltransferase
MKIMTSKVNNEYTIYFAGPLFDHKDLIGNSILSCYIDKVSEGRYLCLLPQDSEQAVKRLSDIRNQDLSYVMSCDLAIFNFDGDELDSGTVVEFLYAKLLDVPSLIIRSDFRDFGNQGREGDLWNLMASSYPRTSTLEFNSMEWYQQENNATESGEYVFSMADSLYRKFARLVITELEALTEEPPLLSTKDRQVFDVYKWASLFPGNELKKVERILNIDAIINAKKEKGLIG